MTIVQMLIIALKIFGVIMAIIGFITLIFLLCGCKVSGNCSRKEEEAYIPKHLDPKDLDDEIKWDEDIYDDEFVKKGTEDEEK